MTKPQILIQKAYITMATPFDVASFAPLSVLSVASEVQGFLHPDPNRYEYDAATGIIHDPLTGLMWSKDETDELEWDASAKACSDCRLGGYTDWYQPNRYEQLTILDLERHEPCLPPIFNTSGRPVWTSTQTAWAKGKAGSSRSFFYVSLNYGSVSLSYANSQLRARPVRRAAPASQ
ncbi:MAG: DUF1566 domain-containing protein [Rhodanobacter sp.]